MKYVQLGTTDLTVSRICFGTWQLSPHFWGEVPLEPWEAALRRAVDLGVTFFDTADAYGAGLAETRLGAFFQRENLRNRVVIATKFYYNFETSKTRPDTSYDYILRACEASLRRLQTDVIDLYQIHGFDPLTRPEEVAAALHTLRKQGKVRWFGVSNLNPEQIRMYARHFEIHCLQPEYSLLERGAEEQELPHCLAHRIGVIVYSPMCRGLLSGKYGRDHVFTDRRQDHVLFAGKAFQQVLDGLEGLRPFATDLGLTLPQLAVRWVLTHPAVTSAIAGVKTPEHIEGVAAAADCALPAPVWHEVTRIMDRARKEALAGQEGTGK